MVEKVDDQAGSFTEDTDGWESADGVWDACNNQLKGTDQKWYNIKKNEDSSTI